MQIVDRGSGIPLVLIPGIQGRWEYMQPAAEVLSRHFRLLTFSLRGEPGSGLPAARSDDLDSFVAQVEIVLDKLSLRQAVICGVSFGGLVALRFAARHPDRVSALVLVSTPGPGWHLARRHQLYLRAPWLFGPLFLAEVPGRVRAELRRSLPSVTARGRFSWRQLRTLATAPLSFSRMAHRGDLIDSTHLARDATDVKAPTLVVTGEISLDRIVPVEDSRRYGALIENARISLLADTGHLGYLTRPQTFTDLVRDFVARACGTEASQATGATHDAA